MSAKKVSDEDRDELRRFTGFNLREHIRHRPDTYLDARERSEQQNVRVYDERAQRMVKADSIAYSPALLQCIQELLTNAGDQQFKDASMHTIKITLPASGATSRDEPIVVENDGNGIAVLEKEVCDEQEDGAGKKKAKRAKSVMWLPSMCFGRFLSSDNYDDSQVRHCGGRNGYGAKLSNVMSRVFTVEVKDPRRHKHFSQEWRDGMTDVGKPSIRAHKGANGMVRVSMVPDYAYFGYEDGALDESTRRMIVTRVYDLAACTDRRVRIVLNGETIGVRSLDDYGNLVLGGDKQACARFTWRQMVPLEQREKQYDDAGNEKGVRVTSVDVARVEMLVGACDDESGGQVIGFVNGLPCDEGSHAAALVDRVVNDTLKHFAGSRSKKDAVTVSVGDETNSVEFCDYAAIRPPMVRRHMRVVVKVLVDNPTFESQTKKKLVTPVGRWGFRLHLDAAKVAADMQRIGVLRLAMEDAAYAQQKAAGRELAKAGVSASGSTRSLGDVPDVDKYEHARLATGRSGVRCTLILTEGDSAKDLAMAGRRAVGPDRYGVFPLRGKLVNTRDATLATMTANAEMRAILTILGGQGPNVQSSKQLRYQHVLVMSDADPDGGHIGGLVLNSLQQALPTVVENEPTFLGRFATPVRYATLKAKSAKAPSPLMFLTEPEYEQWLDTGRIPKANVDANGKVPSDAFATRAERLAAYHVKYLKGLGTSTNAMALDYFRRIEQFATAIDCSGDENREYMDMFYNAARVNDRKRWLSFDYDAKTFVDYERPCISFRHYADGELGHYGIEANQRALVHVMDGLAVARRKVLYAAMCCRGNPYAEEKVENFAGAVITATSYHHGAASLQKTIVHMAQNFLGTNNVNLLYPSGMFGSRSSGPNVHAAPRYIITYLERIARTLFVREDDAVLYREYGDDARPIEPRYFVPVLPTLLLNGATGGIGWGFSGTVPAYDPRDVVSLTRHVARQYCQWADAMRARAKRKSGRHFSLGRNGYIPADENWLQRYSDQDRDTGVWVSSYPDMGDDVPTPWYDLYDGRIVEHDTQPNTYVSHGCVQRVDATHVRVTELPVGVWRSAWIAKVRSTCRYYPAGAVVSSTSKKQRKAAATKATKKGGKATIGAKRSRKGEAAAAGESPAKAAQRPTKQAVGFVTAIDDRSDDLRVDVTFTCDRAQLAAMSDEKLVAALGLSATISTNNMTMFDVYGRIKRYTNVVHIVRDFAPVRYVTYEYRKDYELGRLRHEQRIALNKKRFLEEYMDETIVIVKRSNANIVQQLRTRKYDPLVARYRWVHPEDERDDAGDATDQQLQADDDANDEYGGYGYLVRQPIASLSQVRWERLVAECAAIEEHIAELERTSVEQLWMRDLDAFETEYAAFLERKRACLAVTTSDKDVSKQKKKSASSAAKKRVPKIQKD